MFKALRAPWKPRFTSKFTSFWSMERCTSLMQQSLQIAPPSNPSRLGFLGLDDFQAKAPAPCNDTIPNMPDSPAFRGSDAPKRSGVEIVDTLWAFSVAGTNREAPRYTNGSASGR